MPLEIEAREIEAVARAHDAEFNARLLGHIRHLDQAYLNEKIEQINAQASNGKNG